MIRARFYLPVDDYRPVNWPIKHPYWCSGETGNGVNIIVAYADDIDEIVSNWPEAVNIDVMESDAREYKFTDRFPRPEWFK